MLDVHKKHGTSPLVLLSNRWVAIRQPPAQYLIPATAVQTVSSSTINEICKKEPEVYRSIVRIVLAATIHCYIVALLLYLYIHYPPIHIWVAVDSSSLITSIAFKLHFYTTLTQRKCGFFAWSIVNEAIPTIIDALCTLHNVATFSIAQVRLAAFAWSMYTNSGRSLFLHRKIFGWSIEPKG